MSATPALTAALKRQVLLLEDDLRDRVEADVALRGRWVQEHARALDRARTGASWQAWRDDRVTQAAVGWVLTTVFVRFCEDNGLVGPVWIAGPEQRRAEATEHRLAYFRTHPEDTDREWLLQAVAHLASLPATAPLVDIHAALHLVAPSGDAASALLAFWQARGDDGRLVHDLADPALDTRFLGDLYQDLSDHAKATYALLQTPVFVEEFILDRTLEPALRDRPLEGFRVIDPTCGSGHFLLGAFDRLLDRWHREAPGVEVQARVQLALDAVHGVDLNPFAVAIARFRLTVAAMRACGLASLEQAPAFRFHLAVGDSLLHGPGQQVLAGTGELSAFTYATEDLDVLATLLSAGRYDAVVGNPPYITVKDKVLNQAYRERYRTCSGKYALTVPFMERFFGLAKPGYDGRPAGWVGQITSNSFMKREFGGKLIEEFLAIKDLRLVADTSGAYIPGHGTPTVILVGRNQRPVGDTVRAVLGVRGEPERPDDPSKGLVWTSIVEHFNEPGWDDGWVTVADLPRIALQQHPWSLSGGGAVGLLAEVEEASPTTLRGVSETIGITAFTLEDDVYVAEPSAFATRQVPTSWQREMVLGDGLRDFDSSGQPYTIFPYDERLEPRSVATSSATLRYMWPFRTNLSSGLLFGGKSKVQAGLLWTEFGRLTASKLRTPLSITFAFVATHNHFVLDRGGKVFKQSAPVIKLPAEATEDEHLALLGVLNSSTACFWLKQNCHNKGNEGYASGMKSENWERFYEFTATTLQDYPLPRRLPLDRGRALDALAQRLSASSPQAVAAGGVPTAVVLDTARQRSESFRARMVAQQEELDWEVYRLYGLVDTDLTHPDPPGLALGERAFEIALARKAAAGEEDTAWFARHGSTAITELPAHWAADYRDLVQRRLDLITSDPNIRLLEKPEHKRRWAQEPWEKRQERALRGWLLDCLEDRRFWFDPQGRPAPRSTAQLADLVGRDPDLMSVLALWEGRPDVDVATSLARLLADEAVPYLAADRYKESGLRKREAWEQTWALQRREDAGEQVGVIPVPPKYTSADFTKTAYWSHRGKLDIPKERFVLYPRAGRDTDPSALLGWAGWDHAQQSLALHTVIAEREAEGWDDERLVPLVAGLVELQPWVDQWHSGVGEAGYDLAAFLREELVARRAQVAMTDDQLRAWRPPAPTRGRRPKG